MEALIPILRTGSPQEIRAALLALPKCPPVELMLPFVLQKCLQKKELDSRTIQYIKDCFRMLTNLACLGQLDRKRSAQVHRLALVTEAVLVLDGVTNYQTVGTKLMAIFKEFMDLHRETKEAKQFTYFAMVCNRRTRLLNFKKESKKMLISSERRLKRHGLALLDDLIARM